MVSLKLVAAAALLAQQTLALNAHRHARHAHAQVHDKKAVVYVNDVVTVTDWTIVTVYDDGTPAHTKAIYKDTRPAEPTTSAAATTNSTTSSSTLSSSTSSTSSTTTSTSSSAVPTTTSTPSLSSSTSSTVPPPAPPTTLTTSTRAAAVSSSSPTTATTSNTPVAVPNAAAVADAARVSVGITAAAAATTTAAAAAAAAPTTTTAAAAAATTTTSSSSSSSGTKRGLAYNAGSLLSPFLNSGTKCSWSYNWGQAADASAPSSIEFVPMLWGPTHVDGWSSSAAAAIASGSTHLLSFNECDNAGQCNLDAASAAALHTEYMNPFAGQARIGTPAITNSNVAGEGIDWLKSFVSACNGQCAFDFCAAHWYNGPDTADFLSHLVSVHEACGKPVWITEFAPTGSDDEINSFLETVLSELDNNAEYAFVERYSYFMAATGSLLSSSTELSAYGNTYAYN